jgi:hypothetical protein
MQQCSDRQQDKTETEAEQFGSHFAYEQGQWYPPDAPQLEFKSAQIDGCHGQEKSALMKQLRYKAVKQKTL